MVIKWTKEYWREYKKKYNKEWKLKNPNYYKEYKKKHREKHKKYMGNYNRGYIRKRDYKYETTQYSKKKRIKENLPKKCQVCGYGDVLDIHHLNGRRNKNDFSLSRLKEYVVRYHTHHAMIHRLGYTCEYLRK